MLTPPEKNNFDHELSTHSLVYDKFPVVQEQDAFLEISMCLCKYHHR